MGLAASIYLDSCLAIYLVEEAVRFAAKLETALAAHSEAKFCISLLTEMECLIMPLRQQDAPLIAKFENWFHNVEVLPIEREAFRAAAWFRAEHPSLRTPDASSRDRIASQMRRILDERRSSQFRCAFAG